MTDILALDVATTTGWARGRVGGEPTCGSVCFAKSPHASQSAICGRALEWAIATIKAPLPDMIAIEGLLPPLVLKGKSNEAHELESHLHGIVKAVAFLRGIYKLNTLALNSIRAHFLYGASYGKGEAKHTVVRKCRSLGWLETADDDAADALAVWSYQVSLIDPEQDLRISPLFGRIKRDAIAVG